LKKPDEDKLERNPSNKIIYEKLEKVECQYSRGNAYKALNDQDRNFNISGSGRSRQKFQHFGLWNIKTEISTFRALKDRDRNFNISSSERSSQKVQHFGL